MKNGGGDLNLVIDLVSDEVRLQYHEGRPRLSCSFDWGHDKNSFTLSFWSCLCESNTKMLSYEPRKGTTIKLLIRLAQNDTFTVSYCYHSVKPSPTSQLFGAFSCNIQSLTHVPMTLTCQTCASSDNCTWLVLVRVRSFCRCNHNLDR